MLSQVLVWSHDIGRMTSVSTGHCCDSECMRNEYYKVKMFSNARKYWKFHNKISLAKFYSVKLQAYNLQIFKDGINHTNFMNS